MAGRGRHVGETMGTQTKERNQAAEQARAQLESVIEMVNALRAKRGAGQAWVDEEESQAIQEDALDVQVRSDWHCPSSGSCNAQYSVLLCTGGPAVRIIGNLSEHDEPESAEIQYQDWGTPWETMPTSGEEEEAMVDYAQCFYFGE